MKARLEVEVVFVVRAVLVVPDARLDRDMEAQALRLVEVLADNSRVPLSVVAPLAVGVLVPVSF